MSLLLQDPRRISAISRTTKQVVQAPHLNNCSQEPKDCYSIHSNRSIR